uniref:Uncharacterized protein n=1 Tax=Anguilla anguilla TaxID=7936 RepID=A0A0E9PE04_ANGAN
MAFSLIHLIAETVAVLFSRYFSLDHN